MNAALREKVLTIMTLLARSEFAVAERLAGGRLDADQMRSVITAYGRTVVEPPAGWKAMIDVVEVPVASKPTFSVRVPLVTAEEGRSDLEVWMTVQEVGSQIYEATIDDIRVP